MISLSGWVSIFLHGAFFILGWALFVRLRQLPHSGPLASAKRLSVIIPARNEESRIRPLLESLRQSSFSPLEILVADDSSQDKTATLAQSFGARVIGCPPPPSGWIGKTWACFQGASAARGDVLLFLDADTVLEKDGLSSIMAAMDHLPGALSIQPYHEISKPYENLSAFFNTVQIIASGAFTVMGQKKKGKRMFGPCLAIRKDDYFRIGGHQSVKEEILENFHLSEKLTAAGIPFTCLAGKNTIRFRMYPNDLNELIQGWSKAFSKGAAKCSPIILLATVGWFTGALGTARHLLIALCANQQNLIPLVLVFYSLYALQTRWMLKRIGNFGFLNALLYPIGMVFFVFVFLYSVFLAAAKRNVVWRGRNV